MAKPTKPCVKCGQPRYWRAKTGMCGDCSRRDPETAAKKSASVRARYAADPDVRERHIQRTREHNQSDKMRALAGQKAKALRIWELAKGKRTPEGIERAAKRLSEHRMAHIPPEVRDDYRVLMRAKVPRDEALATVLALHEERMAAFRRKLEESL